MKIRETTTITRYILRSSPLIHAPGCIRYARNLYESKGKGSRKNKQIAKNIVEAWELPDVITRQILDPKTSLVYEGDTVVFIV